jgi:hypothetical protein|tara:strand:+ start:1664 stop:1903 length:240 start_codon:yes stop_codon:yes gene_type:complete
MECNKLKIGQKVRWVRDPQRVGEVVKYHDERYIIRWNKSNQSENMYPSQPIGGEELYLMLSSSLKIRELSEPANDPIDW